MARRLAHIDNAPPQLIRSLAFDDAIAVAQPVLIHAQQLSDADLVENATTKSQDHLFAIAQRLRLSERVTDVLVERGNRKVIHKVAANTGARFSLAGYDKLTHRARRDRKLTLALARRRDLPRQYFLKLLETASASVRAKLEELQQKHPLIGDVRGMGLMQGLELVKDQKTKEPAPEATNQFMERCRANGLLIGKGGLYGNVIRLSPPLNISQGDVDDAIRLMDKSLAETK